MNRTGFSLVELSIVLVILGLLTGGILAGQSLIRAAELRGVSTDIAKVQTASMSFRDKYFAIPGDFTKATTFWGNASTGTAGGECATPADDAGTGTQTCNGDGDGMIGRSVSDNLSNSELFRYWQHLANAGLIEGSYSGVASNTPAGSTNWRVAVPGTNVPRARLPNAGLYAVTQVISSNGSGGTSWTGGDVGQMKLWLGMGLATAGDLPWTLSLKPEELWNIDTKMDDGKPGTGVIRSHAAVTTCVDSNVATTAVYVLTSTAVGCTAYVDMKI